MRLKYTANGWLGLCGSCGCKLSGHEPCDRDRDSRRSPGASDRWFAVRPSPPWAVPPNLPFHFSTDGDEQVVIEPEVATAFSWAMSFVPATQAALPAASQSSNGFPLEGGCSDLYFTRSTTSGDIWLVRFAEGST